MNIPAHVPLGRRGENLSVVIPTYNCAAYLRETLQSLKDQEGSWLEEAQILVVDDCSTKDDPHAVVNQVWRDRVQFLRQPQNLGPCANFNSCIDHAEREWIHILHGDDFVFPSAYQEFSDSIESTPGAIAVFARAVTVNEDSKWMTLPRLLGDGWRGPLPYDPVMWSSNPVACSAVLISRRAIERAGKFDCSFCHCQDWNLWWRIAKAGPVAYSDRCIAAYREFQGNHTSTLLTTGKHFEEMLEQLHRLVASLNGDCALGYDPDVLYEHVYDKLLSQCRVFLGDPEPFNANFRMFEHLPASFRKRRRRRILQLQHLERVFRNGMKAKAANSTGKR
jgi:glycosyltransferase involved in cell wall biosynthesis